MEGLYALIILNAVIDTPSRKYPSATNNISSEFPDILGDDVVVIGITVPAYNKGNPMPAIAIGTIPLCNTGKGIIAINTSVSAIINFEIIELSGIDEIESNICNMDILRKTKSSTLNKLIVSRIDWLEYSQLKMASGKIVILRGTDVSWFNGISLKIDSTEYLFHLVRERQRSLYIPPHKTLVS